LVILTVILTGCGTTTSVPAANTNSPADVQVTDAWARPTVAADQAGTDAATQTGGTGAAYVTLTNTGTIEDALLSVESEIAGMIMIHETKVEDEMASMTEIGAGGIIVPGGQTVILKPKATHIMFMGLNRQFVAGETFEMTLRFKSGKVVTVPVSIENRE